MSFIDPDDDLPVNVAFRKFPDGDVIAFISGYPCNDRTVMSYMHIGQHGEASTELLDDLESVSEDDYKDLLNELRNIGYDVTVVDKI